MYQSPSVRLYTSENAESLVQRKPGCVLQRKPFVDRSVNSKTPDTGKLLKSKLNFTKSTATIEKPKLSPQLKEDLNAEDYIFSFKDIGDSYQDVWPKPQCFGKEKLVKILRNYCNIEETPPPSPEHGNLEINPIFFGLPDLEVPYFQLDEDLLNKTTHIDLPYLDNSELDVSL